MKRLPCLLLLPVVALAGCGNYINVESQGISGLSSDIDGNITVHMYVCDDNAVTRLDLVGGFYDGPSGSNNPPLGALEPAEPATGYIAINLSDPVPWKIVEPLVLPEEEEKYIIASPHVEDNGLPIPFTKEKYLPNVAMAIGHIRSLEPDLIVRDLFERPDLVYGTPEDFVEYGERKCVK